MKKRPKQRRKERLVERTRSNKSVEDSLPHQKTRNQTTVCVVICFVDATVCSFPPFRYGLSRLATIRSRSLWVQWNAFEFNSTSPSIYQFDEAFHLSDDRFPRLMFLFSRSFCCIDGDGGGDEREMFWWYLVINGLLVGTNLRSCDQITQDARGSLRD